MAHQSRTPWRAEAEPRRGFHITTAPSLLEPDLEGRPAEDVCGERIHGTPLLVQGACLEHPVRR